MRAPCRHTRVGGSPNPPSPDQTDSTSALGDSVTWTSRRRQLRPTADKISAAVAHPPNNHPSLPSGENVTAQMGRPPVVSVLAESAPSSIRVIGALARVMSACTDDGIQSLQAHAVIRGGRSDAEHLVKCPVGVRAVTESSGVGRGGQGAPTPGHFHRPDEPHPSHIGGK